MTENRQIAVDGLPEAKPIKAMPYFKWFMDDADLLRSLYSAEQIGIIFLAVMRYAKDGTRENIPPELTYAIASFQQKVDHARAAYERVSTVRAESGAKGGAHKGAAKRSNSEKGEQGRNTTEDRKKQKPPTKAEFKQVAKEFMEASEVPVRLYEVETLYSNLASNNWTVGKYSISDSALWQEYLYAALFYTNEPYTRTGVKYIFARLVEELHESTDISVEILAERISEVVPDFVRCISDDFTNWSVGESSYPIREYEKAAEHYLKFKGIAK